MSNIKFFAIITLLVLLGCKVEKISTSKTAYIIGSDDIKVLDKTTEKGIGKNILSASVLITTEVGAGKIKFCSGVLIEPKSSGRNHRIISNHHCFAELNDDGFAGPDLLKNACIKTKVYFGFSAINAFNSESRNCLKGSLETDFIGDLSTFELDTPAPQGSVPLAIFDGDVPPEGMEAIIIHHPYIKKMLVQNKETKGSYPAAAITSNNCKVQGRFPKDVWNADPVLPFSFRHSCDLVHGSSGSALVDNKSQQIIGINWGGIKSKNDSKTLDVYNASINPGYIKAFLTGATESYQARIYAQTTIINKGSNPPKLSKSSGTKRTKKSKSGCSTIGQTEKEISNLFFLFFMPFFIIYNFKFLNYKNE